jgi:hypothetical protein
VTGDHVIRFITACAVLAVAVIAAIVSYNHIEHLALVNGQTLEAARLLPASIDGTILASSMVLLDSARRDVQAPILARIMLGAGILATLLANATVGSAHGVTGVMVSGWPAIAFVGCAEAFLAMIRGRSSTPEAADETTPAGVLEAVSEVAPEAGPGRTRPVKSLSPNRGSASGGVHGRSPRTRQPEAVFANEIEAGELPSIREVKHRMKVGQDRAVRIRDELAALLQTSQPAETLA